MKIGGNLLVTRLAKNNEAPSKNPNVWKFHRMTGIMFPFQTRTHKVVTDSAYLKLLLPLSFADDSTIHHSNYQSLYEFAKFFPILSG